MGDGSSPRQRLHLRATLLLACLAQFMVILDVSVVNVALPAIRGGLHFSEQNLQWVAARSEARWAALGHRGRVRAVRVGRAP